MIIKGFLILAVILLIANIISYMYDTIYPPCGPELEYFKNAKSNPESLVDSLGTFNSVSGYIKHKISRAMEGISPTFEPGNPRSMSYIQERSETALQENNFAGSNIAKFNPNEGMLADRSLRNVVRKNSIVSALMREQHMDGYSDRISYA